jgi:hypothetical protein
MLDDSATPQFRAIVKAGLAVLVASLWLVTVHSGGLRSKRLHATVPATFNASVLPRQVPHHLDAVQRVLALTSVKLVFFIMYTLLLSGVQQQ